MLIHKVECYRCFYLCAVLLAVASISSANDVYFQGPIEGGDFHDVANWRAYDDSDPMLPLGTLPAWDDTILIGSTRMPCAQLANFSSADTFTVNDVFIGYLNPGQGTLIIDNPSACLSMQRAIIGMGTQGLLHIKQGLVEMINRETSYIGLLSAGLGSVIIDANGTMQCSLGDLSDEIYLGYNQATGNIDVNGGTFDAVDCAIILGGNGGKGILRVESQSSVNLKKLTAAGQANFELSILDGNFNAINIVKELTINDLSTLSINLAGARAGDTYELFRYGSLLGQFLPENISITGAKCELDMGCGTDDVISLNVIHAPEPTTLALLTLGIFAISRRRGHILSI